MIETSRRRFLIGLLAAPAIVRASSLMAIKPLAVPELAEAFPFGEWVQHTSWFRYYPPIVVDDWRNGVRIADLVMAA